MTVVEQVQGPGTVVTLPGSTIWKTQNQFVTIPGPIISQCQTVSVSLTPVTIHAPTPPPVTISAPPVMVTLPPIIKTISCPGLGIVESLLGGVGSVVGEAGSALNPVATGILGPVVSGVVEHVVSGAVAPVVAEIVKPGAYGRRTDAERQSNTLSLRFSSQGQLDGVSAVNLQMYCVTDCSLGSSARCSISRVWPLFTLLTFALSSSRIGRAGTSHFSSYSSRRPTRL
jgi:hypothetical protein